MVTRNNEPVDIDEKDFDAALKQGLEPAMEYADKDGNVNVVRKSHQAKAEASGLKPLAIYQGQQSASKVKDKLSEGWKGDLEAGARGLANAATLGFSDELSGAAQAAKGAFKKGSLSDLKSDYTKGRDEYREREDAAWDDGGLGRKILYGAGAAVPTLASLGASLPAQGVKQAAILGAKYGAAGAAGGGTGQGQTDLTKGEYGQYAKDLALGGALGGVIGGGLQKGIETLPKIPGALESFARSRATKAAGGDSAKAGRLVDRMPGGKEAFGKDLLESGIVSGGKSRQQMLDKAREIEESSGKNIGDILGQFDSLAGKKGYKSDALKRILERSKAEVLDPLNESPATQELADRVNNKYLGRLEEYVKAKDMGPRSPNDSSLGFKGLQNERRLLDKTAFNETGLDKPLNDKLQAVRRIFNEELLKDAEKVAPKELLDDYARQNRLFGVSTTAKKLTEEQLARQAKNRSISLTDYISGGASGAAGAAAAGPVGLVMAPAAIGLNKLARERGNQMLAGGADKLAKFLKGGAPRSIEERMANEGGFVGKRPLDKQTALNQKKIKAMIKENNPVAQQYFGDDFEYLKPSEQRLIKDRERNAQELFDKPFNKLNPSQKNLLLDPEQGVADLNPRNQSEAPDELFFDDFIKSYQKSKLNDPQEEAEKAAFSKKFDPARRKKEGGFIGGSGMPRSYLREADELSNVRSSVDQPSVLNKSRMSREDVLNEEAQLRFGKDYNDLRFNEKSEVKSRRPQGENLDLSDYVPAVDRVKDTRSKEQQLEDLNNTFKNARNSKVEEEMSAQNYPKSNRTFVEDPNDALRPDRRPQNAGFNTDDYVPAVDRDKPERKTFDSTVDVLKDMYRRYKGSKLGGEGGFIGEGGKNVSMKEKPSAVTKRLDRSFDPEDFSELRQELIDAKQNYGFQLKDVEKLKDNPQKYAQALKDINTRYNEEQVNILGPSGRMDPRMRSALLRELRDGETDLSRPQKFFGAAPAEDDLLKRMAQRRKTK